MRQCHSKESMRLQRERSQARAQDAHFPLWSKSRNLCELWTHRTKRSWKRVITFPCAKVKKIIGPRAPGPGKMERLCSSERQSETRKVRHWYVAEPPYIVNDDRMYESILNFSKWRKTDKLGYRITNLCTKNQVRIFWPRNFQVRFNSTWSTRGQR